VLSPARASRGQRTPIQVEGDEVVVATVAQAFLDELALMPDGLDWVEMARVLRNAVEAGRTDEQEFLALLRDRPSISVARRAGFLFELVRGQPHPELHSLAHTHDDITRVAGSSVTDRTWRLTLPQSRERIARAIR